MAAVQAAKLKLYYLGIASVQKNIFVDTAEPEAIGGTLERFGVVKLGRRPFTAQPGSYGVSVTGSAGATITQGTVFKSNDDSLNASQLYILDADYILTGTADSITLRALEPGLGSQLNIGNELTSTEPIALVDSVGVVVSELITPLAPESIEDYRDKAIEAYRLEPQGGAGSDYRLWSKDAQGVKQSYPYAKTGFSNEVSVYVEATIADSTDGKGTPPTTMLNEVSDVIEFDPDVSKPLDERGRRPLAVFNVDVEPITVKEIDIVITGFQNLDAATETNIFNAVEQALSSIRPFVSSVDIVSEKNDILNVSKITFAIIEAEPGAVFTSVDLTVDSVSQISYLFDLGNIPHLNSITYV